MKNYLLLLASVVCLTFSSCNKADKNDPAPAVQPDPADDPAAIQLTTQLLGANDWQLTALTQNVPGQAIYNDIYNNSFPACQHDDIYSFVSDKTLTIKTGLTTCSASDLGKTGSWSLKNAKTLNINAAALTQAGLTGEFAIFMLDNSKMILKQTQNGSEYIATYEKTVAFTKTQLLTAKPWRITGIIEQSPGSSPTDVFSSFLPCEKDNLFLFKTNGTYDNTEGATKCDPMDPQLIDSGSWQLVNNETILNIDGDSFEVVQITPTSLVLKLYDSGSELTFTFSN